jgi:hypothetical protein
MRLPVVRLAARIVVGVVGLAAAAYGVVELLHGVIGVDVMNAAEARALARHFRRSGAVLSIVGVALVTLAAWPRIWRPRLRPPSAT